MKKVVLFLLAVVMLMSAACTATTATTAETFSATERGYGGDIAVALTIEGDKLVDVAIDGASETQGIGSIAVQELPGKMIAANSVTVDGISGATVSSNAILAAAGAALEKSGVTLVAVAADPQEPVVNDDAQADVVVVGGGIAGMSAAMVLADAGKSVILLEKTAILGGAAVTSHSAVWAIGNEMTVDKYDFTADEIYEFFNRKAGPVHSKEVFYALANESYDSLHFLIDNGVYFNDISACNPQADPRFWFSTSENFGVGMMQKLGETYANRDIDTRMQTAAVKLVQAENGSVTGVIAENNGSQYTIIADNVILATGGIGQNEELMAKYVPGYENIVINLTVPGATGDGHIMGSEAGGYLVGSGSMGAGTTATEMGGVAFGNSLMINSKGEKVGAANEHYTKVYEIVNAQDDGKVYSIFPADIEKYSREGNQDVMERNYQAGEILKADTLEELAEQAGINVETLLETVATHNEQCAAGITDGFNSPIEEMVPILTGPFYLEPRMSGIIGTITGLAVNDEMKVLTENGGVVENLYAVGEMIYGNWFEGNYPMSGTGLGGCVSSGRIAAAEIIQEIN